MHIPLLTALLVLFLQTTAFLSPLDISALLYLPEIEIGNQVEVSMEKLAFNRIVEGSKIAAVNVRVPNIPFSASLDPFSEVGRFGKGANDNSETLLLR